MKTTNYLGQGSVSCKVFAKDSFTIDVEGLPSAQKNKVKTIIRSFRHSDPGKGDWLFSDVEYGTWHARCHDGFYVTYQYTNGSHPSKYNINLHSFGTYKADEKGIIFDFELK